MHNSLPVATFSAVLAVAVWRRPSRLGNGRMPRGSTRWTPNFWKRGKELSA